MSKPVAGFSNFDLRFSIARLAIRFGFVVFGMGRVIRVFCGYAFASLNRGTGGKHGIRLNHESHEPHETNAV